MRVLVTGGSGFVGWRVVESLVDAGHAVAYTYHSTEPISTAGEEARFHMDIRDAGRVDTVVDTFEPDVVVHAAALTDADECERNPSLARELNVTGTQHVIRACEGAGASVAFLSSSFVFDGENNPYVESDATSPVNVYGETKAVAEKIVRDATGTNLVCRIDQPYDWLAPWHEHTFVEWVLEQCKRDEPFPVFEDWYNTPVYVPDAANALRALLSQDADGVYHVVGHDYVSRYEWACTTADVFGYDSSLVRRGNSSDKDLPARRPNAHLSNRKVLDETDCTFHSLEDGAITMREATD